MLTRVSHFSTNIDTNQTKYLLCNLSVDNLSLAGVTSSTKVFIIKSCEEKSPQYLSIDQDVTAITAGKLNQELDRSCLVVGTRSRLLIYDVFENVSLCDKEIDNGVTALTVGCLGDSSQPLVFVGGNCSLQGFTAHGEEKFWSVMSDNVLSVELVDVDSDGQNELVVGTEDCFIRIFKENAIIVEVKETDSVTALKALNRNLFAYALSNGTIGVYEKGTRLWRIKSKHQAVSLEKFVTEGEVQTALVTGWSHGKFDVRHPRTGEVVHKESAGDMITTLACGDFHQMGFKQLLVCCTTGEISAYAMEGQAELSRRVREDDEILRDLLLTKRNLQTELQNYERTKSSTSLIHIETLLEHRDHRLELVVRSTLNIHAVIIFAEGVFQQGESHVIHAPVPGTTKTLAVPLSFKPNASVDLQLKVIVSDDKALSEVLLVHEMTHSVPSFASLKILGEKEGQQFQGSLIKFRIQERLQRVLFWVEQSFVFSAEQAIPPILPSGVSLNFRDVRTGSRVDIEGSPEGLFVLKTDDLDLAGDLVHSLCSFLKIEHLPAEVKLSPSLNEEILGVFDKIQGLQSARKLLASGLAEQVNQVLGCRNQLQNSFLLLQMDSLQTGLRDSRSALELLQNESEKCAANHNELLLLLKHVNRFIQRTAKCRVGKNQTDVIFKCRTALKENDLDLLIKILTIGF